MSKYNNGILGPFSGRVGNVVGAKWKDQFIMRARPYPKQEIDPTQRQLVQRNRFALASNALRALAGAVNTGFRFNAALQKMTARNIAMRETMQGAMTFSGGVWTLDPSEMVVSRGLFGNIYSLTAGYSAGNMTVTWQNNAGETIGILPSGDTVPLVDDDQIFCVFYNATKGEARYDVFTTYERVDGAGMLAKPANWEAADDVYVFVFTMPERVYAYITGGTLSEQQVRFAEELIANGYGVSTSGVAKVPIV